MLYGFKQQKKEKKKRREIGHEYSYNSLLYQINFKQDNL